MDNSIFSAIYKTHVDNLYSYGIGLGYSHDICLDAIHDVFCKLYSLNLPDNINNLKYYLLKSFKNRLVDIQKSTKKEIINDNINDSLFVIDVSVSDFIIDHEEEELIRKKVEVLMNILTDRQREAIYLRYMQELEYEEIGKLLQMNAESVRKLVYRGFEKIRQNTDPDLLGLIFFLLFFANTK